jgi:hypothetical protein
VPWRCGAPLAGSVIPFEEVGWPLSPWANIRLALVAGWSLWALLTFEQLDLFTVLAPISLVYAIMIRIVF